MNIRHILLLCMAAAASISVVAADLTVKSSDTALGKVKVVPADNTVGSTVTLRTNYILPRTAGDWGLMKTHPSRSVKFTGWYNSQGELISEDTVCTYVVEKAETLEARYEREFALKADADNKVYGYYRLNSPLQRKSLAVDANYFLCVTGNFAPNMGTNIKSRYVRGAVEFNNMPKGNTFSQAKSDEYAQSEAVYADAGSILYLSGTATKDLNATKAQTQVVKNLVAEAQGVSTGEIIPNQTIHLKTSDIQGQYVIYTSYLFWTLALRRDYYNTMLVSTDYSNKDAEAHCLANWDIQPVDEEHIDTNYFGAYPDASMEYDGGYWTSMYTSFPYECYAPDGVEAYVANETVDYSGATIVTIRRLESGIVPERTPVLLKCNGLTPKENRLIPLLPGDSRIAEAKEDVGTNLLKGDFSLFTSCTTNGYQEGGTYSGRPVFNNETMRVFAMKDGELGFYSLAPNDDGSQQELIPNRAYLDMTLLGADAATKPAFRIRYDQGAANGIDEISPDADICAPEEYYTIQGIKVANPEPGHIYIVRQGSKAKKVKF